MVFMRLQIVDEHGSSCTICGEEDLMRGQFQELADAMAAVDGTESKTMKIHGVCDSYDRAEHSLIVRPSRITGLSLIKVY